MRQVKSCNENNYPVCPKCGEAHAVEGGHVEIDGNIAWQGVTCLNCGAFYTEVYTYSLTEIWDEED